MGNINRQVLCLHQRKNVYNSNMVYSVSLPIDMGCVKFYLKCAEESVHAVYILIRRMCKQTAVMNAAFTAALYLRVRRLQQMNCLYFALQREMSEMDFSRLKAFL